MTEPVDVVVMLGALGPAAAEQLLQRARWLATLHTLQQLADCANVGRIVLAAFGSIQKLRKGTAEEIAEVSGVSVKLAADIVEFLAKRV